MSVRADLDWFYKLVVVSDACPDAVSWESGDDRYSPGSETAMVISHGWTASHVSVSHETFAPPEGVSEQEAALHMQVEKRRVQ